MIRTGNKIKNESCENIHGGDGKIIIKHVLLKEDSDLGIQFMHDDTLEPGTVVGEHYHDNEEVYYVLEGEGIMIIDGERYPIKSGDVSLIKRGQTHGLINSKNGIMRIIVICFDPNKDV